MYNRRATTSVVVLCDVNAQRSACCSDIHLSCTPTAHSCALRLHPNHAQLMRKQTMLQTMTVLGSVALEH
jgi:hypothetical protein